MKIASGVLKADKVTFHNARLMEFDRIEKKIDRILELLEGKDSIVAETISAGTIKGAKIATTEGIAKKLGL
jgi:hypothetical protein